MSETAKDNIPEHEKRRSGFESSEFLLTLLVAAVSAILPIISDAASDYVSRTPYAFIAPAIAAAGYAISRAIVKKSRNDASATVQAAKVSDEKCDSELYAVKDIATDYVKKKVVNRVLDDFTGNADAFSFAPEGSADSE